MSPAPPDGSTPGKPLAAAPWLREARLQRLLEVLEQDGGAARVVGGAIRNALLGEAITDIDIATPHLPAEVMRRAAAAGFSVHPTGIEHGTVTVVAGGHPFEVTTLRRDVETDGRRAVVAFSQDWREDAARRDFTINALSATRDGALFDYFGGLADLGLKRVRFIGSARQRIAEDYLRILRFFRFHAQYGHGAPDAEGLAACVALKAGIARLSGERIGAEMLKLLAAPGAGSVAGVTSEASILRAVFGDSVHAGRLVRLIAIEAAHGFSPDALTRLGALALDAPHDAEAISQRLRLSSAQTIALAAAARRHAAFDPATCESEARRWLYRIGADAFTPAALVDWASGNADVGDGARAERARLPLRWRVPKLPVRGADVLALGVPAGPKVGDVLEAFENWWVSADFPGDVAMHQSKLSALAADELLKR